MGRLLLGLTLCLLPATDPLAFRVGNQRAAALD